MATEQSRFWMNIGFLRLVGFGTFRAPAISANGPYQIWPNFPWQYAAFAFPMVFLCMVLFAILSLVEIFNYSRFEDIVKALSFVMVHLTLIPKSVIFLIRSEKLQHIFFNLDHHMKTNHRQHEKITAQSVRLSQRILITFELFIIATISASLAKIDFGLFFASGDVSFPANAPLPYVIYIPWTINGPISYMLACLTHLFGMISIGSQMAAMDTTFISFMIHIRAQFKALNISLRDLKKNAYISLSGSVDLNTQNKSLDNDVLQKAIILELRKCIAHHQHIIRCVNDIEDLFNLGFLSLVFSGLMGFCLNLLAVTQLQSNIFQLAIFVFLSLTISVQLGAQCWAGEEVTYQAFEVYKAAYECGWEDNCCMSFCQDLRFLIKRAQTPVKLTAGKFGALSLGLYVAILRGAYSYFAVINSMKSK